MVTIDGLRQDMDTGQGEHGPWLLWVQHRAGKQGQLWDAVAQSWEWRQLCQAPSPAKGIPEPRHTVRSCGTSWECSSTQQSCSAPQLLILKPSTRETQGGLHRRAGPAALPCSDLQGISKEIPHCESWDCRSYA